MKEAKASNGKNACLYIAGCTADAGRPNLNFVAEPSSISNEIDYLSVERARQKQQRSGPHERNQTGVMKMSP
jgi:hypothetical protein